jgi:hypothetical protein
MQAEGGFVAIAALNKSVTINLDDLPEDEAGELKQLLSATRFFELPKRLSGLAAGAADYRQYKITIEDEKKKHTVYLADVLDDPQLRQLLDFLKARMA